MADEPYWNEHPDPDDGGGDGSGDGGVSGGGWGGGGGGGGGGGSGVGGGWGGGGGGGGGGGDSGWGWQWSGGDDEDDGDGQDKKFNAPFLKRSYSGYLLRQFKRLLTGTLSCELVPPVLIYIENDEDRAHTGCMLIRLVGTRRSFRIDSGLTEEQFEAGLAAFGYFNWAMTGEFQIQIKWQAGHYSHAVTGKIKLVIYGVDLGWRTAALSTWQTFATIRIVATDDGHEVWVNNIRGSINGNADILGTI